MNRLRFCTGIAALAFLFVSASAWSQTDLGKRVSIDVNSVAPQEVFGSLARSLGCEASVDPAVQQPVTLRVVDVSARTALSAICESIGCRYRLDGNKLVIEPLLPKTQEKVVTARIKADRLQILKKPLPQGLRFENVPLSSVLKAVSDASGFDISIEPTDPDKKVTVDVSGQTFQEALKRIITVAGTGNVVAIGVTDDSKLKMRIKLGATKKKAPVL